MLKVPITKHYAVQPVKHCKSQGTIVTSRRSIDSSNLVTKLRTPTRDQSLPASATVAGSVASPVVQTQEAAG